MNCNLHGLDRPNLVEILLCITPSQNLDELQAIQAAFAKSVSIRAGVAVSF